VARIGVALSGGGHRATLWGAGSVLALADAGLAPAIVSISSVSGGSIANGVFAHDGDVSASDADVEGCVARLARLVVDRGLFFFGPATDGWIARFLALALAVGAVVAAVPVSFLLAGRDVPPWWLLLLGVPGLALAALAVGRLRRRGMPGRAAVPLLVAGALAGVPACAFTALTTHAHEPGPVVLAAVGVLAVTALAVLALLAVFNTRSAQVERALATELFSTDGRPTPLAAVDRRVHHVFCTTDLQAGDQLYLTPRLVSGYRHGFGTPGDLTLARAVQCSACLPGAFAPRRLPNRFGFRRQYDTDLPGFPAPPEVLVVNDGGVYDNMADQWEQGYRARARRAGSPLDPAAGAELLVVANAGMSYTWRPWRSRRLLDDVDGFKRTVDILYDVSTAHRRQKLVEGFRSTTVAGGLDGLVVHIASSPMDVARAFADGGDERAQRAAEALAVLGAIGDRAWWRARAEADAAVTTTLGRLGADTVVNLLWHAYVLTRVGMYVVHGLGPAPTPASCGRARIASLLADRA
jgi:hypothetical protein